MFCCVDLDGSENHYEKEEENTPIIEFRTNTICDVKTKDSFLKYYYQFYDRKNLFRKIISGDYSNKIYFQELLEDNKFRDKVINFYTSQKIKEFIKKMQ